MPPSRIQASVATLLVLISAACVLLPACSQQTSPLLDSIKPLLRLSAPPDDSRLNPEYEHLRVTLGGRSAFVTLGDIDKRADGDIHVYYGGGGLVMRLQNGRLAGINGLLTEWRDVVLRNAPAWQTTALGKQIEWHRTRDVMPGYHYGVTEKIAVALVGAPAKNPLRDASADGLHWFQEQVIESNAAHTAKTLPPARYAVSFANQQATVVYGEQCIAADTCLTWQQWTPSKR